MTTTPDPTSLTEQPPKDLEEAATKPNVPMDFHMHFDMPADSQAGMVEFEAHKYCKKYFGDIEYRLNLEVVAQINDSRIIGYKVTIKARKWIDYGEW